MRLDLLADAEADRQILPRADVVLHVHARLHVADFDERIADVPRERRRMSRGVGVEAREGERAAGVAKLVGAVPAALDEESRANGVAADRDVEVVGDFEVLRAPCRRRAARRPRRTRSERARRAPCWPDRSPSSADRHWNRNSLKSDLRSDPDVETRATVSFRVCRYARPVEVEIADAEVVVERVVPLHLGAQDLRPAERVLDARRDVQRPVGPADGIREVARRERGDDRLRIERVEPVDRQRERRLLLLSGPLSEKPARSLRSSGLTGANAFLALRTESRKPMLVAPRQLSKPGLVMMSTETNPGSCVSAANMFRWNRIWRSGPSAAVVRRGSR